MDAWRVVASMRTNVNGRFEDDAERFFGRHPSRVSNADMWRWRAACEAVREMTGEV